MLEFFQLHCKNLCIIQPVQLRLRGNLWKNYHLELVDLMKIHVFFSIKFSGTQLQHFTHAFFHGHAHFSFTKWFYGLWLLTSSNYKYVEIKQLPGISFKQPLFYFLAVDFLIIFRIPVNLKFSITFCMHFLHDKVVYQLNIRICPLNISIVTSITLHIFVFIRIISVFSLIQLNRTISLGVYCSFQRMQTINSTINGRC